MPAYDNCQSMEIEATPEQCFHALTDYERLPEWQGAVEDVVVHERDEEGRGTVVEYVIDAKVKTVRYRLRQVYDAPYRVGSEYLGGDFRDFAGEWRFTRSGPGTYAELDLRIDPGSFVPGPLRRLIRDAVMKRALGDLKRRVESAAAPR